MASSVGYSALNTFRIVAGSSVGVCPREIIVLTPSCEEKLFCILIKLT